MPDNVFMICLVGQVLYQLKLEMFHEVQGDVLALLDQFLMFHEVQGV